MAAPCVENRREPRRLLYSLSVIPLGADLVVEQEWYSRDMQNGRRKLKMLRGAHSVMPVNCVYRYDFMYGWHHMALVLKQLGLPYRRVIVTEYAYQNAMEKSA